MTEVAFSFAGIGLFLAVFIWLWQDKTSAPSANILMQREIERQQMLRITELRAKIEKVRRETPDHVKRRIERAARKARGDS